MSDDGDSNYDLPNDAAEFVDTETFLQILEMDDEPDDRDFSRGLVVGFFEQAETTFKDMDDCIEKKDLAGLSSYGHFLKGSSATLGLFKVKDICEKIQNLGAKKDETGTDDIEENVALERIKKILPTMKKDYYAAEAWLRSFYRIDEDETDDK